MNTFNGGRAYVDLQTNEPEESTDLLFFFVWIVTKRIVRDLGSKNMKSLKEEFFLKKKNLLVIIITLIQEN